MAADIKKILAALSLADKVELAKQERRVCAERVRLALEWKAKQTKDK